MRRAIGLSALILAVLAAGAADAQETRPAFMTFLSVNDVRGVASDGTRLWLATSGGAVSYDPATGEQRVFHRERDGLLSDSVTAVTVAPDGKVWFGTQQAGISILDPGTDQWEPYTSQLEPIPGNRITRLRFVQDSLFVASKQGFALFVGENRPAFYLDGISLGLPSSDIRDLAGGSDGLWISTAAGVAHRDPQGAYTVYPNTPGNPAASRIVRYQGKWVTAFANDLVALRLPEGTWEPLGTGRPTATVTDLLVEGSDLYIATDQGVWKYDGSAYTRLGSVNFTAISLCRGPDGKLYTGAIDSEEQKNGLRWFDGEEWQRITFPGPSSRSHYRALAFDSNGVLHTSLTGPGYYQTFNGSQWSVPRSLRFWTFDIVPEPGGGLWLAHCCCRLPDCPLELYRNGDLTEEVPRNLWDLAYDDQGNLWGASFNDSPDEAQGIWRRSAATGEWMQITTDTQGADLFSNKIRAVLPVGHTLWIGYAERGVAAWDLGDDGVPLTGDGEIWAYYSIEEVPSHRLASNDIRRLAYADGKVWAGTTNGVSIITSEGVRNIGTGFNRLPQPVVNALIPLADGGAWVATEQGGVTRMTPTDVGFTFTTYGPPDIPNPNVETMALDPDGRSVWLGTSRGLARLTPRGSAGSEDVPVTVYPNPYIIGCGAGVRLVNAPGLVNGIVVDLSGKLITRFERRGTGDLIWDGRDRNKNAVAPGLYMIRVSTSQGTRGVGVGVMDGPCR